MTIAVAMRMPYQRMTIGPTWNAIEPGELITRGSTERRISRGYDEARIQRARHDFMIVAVAEEAVERRNVCAPRERDRDAVRAPRS
jgi:hypothetical protein